MIPLRLTVAVDSDTTLPHPTPSHSGIAVLNIENELAKNIDYDEVVDIFKTVPSLRDAALAAADSIEVSARRLELYCRDLVKGTNSRNYQKWFYCKIGIRK